MSRTYTDVMKEESLKRQEVRFFKKNYDVCILIFQLEVRGKIAKMKEDGNLETLKPAERKRGRWDQSSAADDAPSRKKSSWDQSEVRHCVNVLPFSINKKDLCMINFFMDKSVMSKNE